MNAGSVSNSLAIPLELAVVSSVLPCTSRGGDDSFHVSLSVV